MGAAPDELIARFRADYERLLTAAEPADHRIALAVSGGPDSMAMLGLAAAAFPGRVIAATVDHGLRAESAHEAEIVARTCSGMGVPHATLNIAAPRGASGNLHDWARQERYLSLERWAVDQGAPALCTAHHTEDQAETFLMRATRASGLSGLSGIRARTDTIVPLDQEPKRESYGGRTMYRVCYRPIILLRPLLRWRRSELRAAAETMGLPFVDDPSNRDPRFDRTRFRALLADAPWIDPGQIARTADNIASMEADLRAVSQWLWETRVLEAPERSARIDIGGLPRGVKRYLVRLAIDHILSLNGLTPGNWSSAANVEALLDALEAGKAATQAGVLVSAKGTTWHFRKAPPRRAH